MLSVRKTLAVLASVVTLASIGLVAAPAAAATSGTLGSPNGAGTVLLLFHNLEGVTEPTSNPGPTLSGTALGYSVAAGPRMYLSDEVLNGTFALNFFLTHRGVPQFDRFKVLNTGDVPITLTLVQEIEFNLPNTPVVDSELSVCFLQGCDVGFWVPDGAIAPPAALLQLQPGQEAQVTVGLRLEPNADWSKWNNRLRFSILKFEAQA